MNLHLFAHQELSLALCLMLDKLSAGTKVPALLEKKKKNCFFQRVQFLNIKFQVIKSFLIKEKWKAPNGYEKWYV